MQKVVKIVLFFLGLIFCLYIQSRDIDRDLGWHLRFGRDAWNGQFQYLDTYTWPHYLQPWTNHEWGTDLLYWPVFKNFGYLPILFFYTLVAWLSFVFINRIYFSRLSTAGLFFSFVAIFAASPVLVPRPAVFVLPFLVFIIWTLEKLPQKKLFYLWPPAFWVWSWLHGSWALGFILINIFLCGQVAQILLQKYFHWAEKNTWQWRDVVRGFLWQIPTVLILLVNPYRAQIITEVINYFRQDYFKDHITEWVPSYTFPVFWLPLIFATIGAMIIVYAWWKKKASLAEMLVYLALFYAAWKYKRNMVLPAFTAVPIFTFAFGEVWKELLEKTKLKNFLQNGGSKKLYGVLFLVFLSFIVYFFPKINWQNRPWEDKEYMFYKTQFPYEAAEVLRNDIGVGEARIFNEFGWGAYLNWAAQNALVFLDGRGTATWMWDKDITVLQKYRKLKLEEGGLEALEGFDVRYVLLKSEKVSSFMKPDAVNTFLFPGNKLDKVLFAEPSQLEQDLRASGDWELIHEDYLSNLWRKK